MANDAPQVFTRPTMVKLEPSIHIRLERLAKAKGYTVAALIRWCVDKGLPILEKNLTKV